MRWENSQQCEQFPVPEVYLSQSECAKLFYIEFHVEKVSEAKTFHKFNLCLFNVVAYVVTKEICIQ